MKSASRPGDVLLERYFKDADERTRERARDAFREFARALEELGEEVSQRGITDSPDEGTCDRIPSLETP